MFPFQIPIGRTYTCTLRSSMLKHVVCERCARSYAYAVDAKASRSRVSLLWLNNKGAAARAQKSAEKVLRKRLANAVTLAPCHRCGWYQKDMVRFAKRHWLAFLSDTNSA